jgi:hypothetical protein
MITEGGAKPWMIRAAGWEKITLKGGGEVEQPPDIPSVLYAIIT